MATAGPPTRLGLALMIVMGGATVIFTVAAFAVLIWLEWGLSGIATALGVIAAFGVAVIAVERRLPKDIL